MNHHAPYHERKALTERDFNAAGFKYLVTFNGRRQYIRGKWKLFYSEATNRIEAYNIETNAGDFMYLKDREELYTYLHKIGADEPLTDHKNYFPMDMDDQLF
jgi:hypothetical protein